MIPYVGGFIALVAAIKEAGVYVNKLDTAIGDIRDIKTEIREMKLDITKLKVAVGKLIGRIGGLENRMTLLERRGG